jgi:hypothetical protein
VSIEERRIVHTIDLEEPIRSSAVVWGETLVVVDEEGNARAYRSS